MNETFKIVPRIYHLLYLVYTPVGDDTYSRMLSLVFALLSSKSKECCNRIF